MAGDRGPTRQAILLLVCDEPDAFRQLRAGQRHVMRWLPDGADDQVAQQADVIRGNPADPETFSALHDATSVTAVVGLSSGEQASRVLDAIRDVRPDAAALVLSAAVESASGDGTLSRKGSLRDVLRIDLEEELQRIEAERRLFRLREFAAGDSPIPVLVHPDPDPDALSSALCLRKLLYRKGHQLPIVTTRTMSRPENRRMAELLRLRVTEVTESELLDFDRLIVVDSQPAFLRGRSNTPRLAVIDHHPLESGYDAEFLDVRDGYGATATILTEYLRSDDRLRINAPLATAMLYGIQTDTDGLARGVSAADVSAYAHLQRSSDPMLLRRMKKPSYPLKVAQSFGRAIGGLLHESDLVVAWVGSVDNDAAHIFADVADFCIGIEAVTWAIAAGLLESGLVLTIRHAGKEPGAGGLARRLAGSDGRGGGHTSMARVHYSQDSVPAWFSPDSAASSVAEEVRRQIRSMTGAAKKNEVGSG
jgi:nanoRNase/pAp phosphatase (c-di-AMP/oligoRNAs hydrolase)